MPYKAHTTSLRRTLLFITGSSVVLTLIAGSWWWLDARTLISPNTTDSVYTENLPEPFPVGVDPEAETITEQAAFEEYILQHFSDLQTAPTRLSLITERITNLFKQSAVYQHLASPSARQLIIEAGDRPEQLFIRSKKLFGWDETEQAAFVNIIDAGLHTHTVLPVIPGTYNLPAKSSPIAVYDALETAFLAELKSRYPDSVAAILPLRDAVIIASLLEREAADFYDMRYISGVIWNRLFIDMNLQIDATLQYAKATAAGSAVWPPVVPDDKFIDSPFNTYKNAGLPPGPIAIPSVGSVIAALNPRQTDCMFYFHSRNRSFFCSPTYEEHVEKLIQQYGQGR